MATVRDDRTDREIELEDRFHYDKQLEKQRAHEKDMLKLQLAVPQRAKTLERIIISVCKVPALVLLAILLPMLVLFGKNIPKPLAEFLVL